MSTRGVVLGLDGVAWHLLEPLIHAGAMPRLRQLREIGASGTLRSTIPPYTAPAWTSAFTGVNPGRHGVFGFFRGNLQRDLQLLHGGMIKSATLWEVANDQGASVGVYNVPVTYPPVALNGWMVSGMMTPHHPPQPASGFTWPPSIEHELNQLIPGYVPDLSADFQVDWQDRTLCEEALLTLDQRRRALQHLLTSRPTDVVFAVIEVPDRIQHVYYGYMDPSDASYESHQAREIQPHIVECFRLIDEIIGLAHDYAGRDGALIICSDHGFTKWEMTVHLNALLAEWGFLELHRADTLLRRARRSWLGPPLRQLIPSTIIKRVKQQRTTSAVNWTQTRAFASPKTYQMLFLNMKGREAFGIVGPNEVEHVKDEIVKRFHALRNPAGEAFDVRVWKSQEAYWGDEIRDAPDIVPMLNENRYYLDTGLFAPAPFENATDLPRGLHHMDGIGLLSGPGIEAGASFSNSIMDVMPTLLYLTGLSVPADLDGSVVEEAFVAGHMLGRPVSIIPFERPGATEEVSPYTPEEQEEIEEKLRGLGYL